MIPYNYEWVTRPNNKYSNGCEENLYWYELMKLRNKVLPYDRDAVKLTPERAIYHRMYSF